MFSKLDLVAKRSPKEKPSNIQKLHFLQKGGVLPQCRRSTGDQVPVDRDHCSKTAAGAPTVRFFTVVCSRSTEACASRPRTSRWALFGYKYEFFPLPNVGIFKPLLERYGGISRGKRTKGWRGGLGKLKLGLMKLNYQVGSSFFNHMFSCFCFIFGKSFVAW